MQKQSLLIDKLDLREEAAKHFPVAYAQPQADPHSVFANLLGVSRQDAKTICYQYAYTTDNLFFGTILKLQAEETNEEVNENV